MSNVRDGNRASLSQHTAGNFYQPPGAPSLLQRYRDQMFGAPQAGDPVKDSFDKGANYIDDRRVEGRGNFGTNLSPAYQGYLRQIQDRQLQLDMQRKAAFESYMPYADSAKNGILPPFDRDVRQRQLQGYTDEAGPIDRLDNLR